MKPCLIAVGLLMLTESTAQAEPMRSQIFEGYQRPAQQPQAKGYVTEDGKRYGTCRNHHHRSHKHCKERMPLPKPKAVPVKPPSKKPPADSKIIRP